MTPLTAGPTATTRHRMWRSLGLTAVVALSTWGITMGSGSVAVANVTLTVCLLTTGLVTFRRFRRGDTIPGGGLIPFATLLSGVGMVVETVASLLGHRGPPTVGNLYFGMFAPLAALATTRYWLRPLWPRPSSVMLRGLMDSVLIGLTVIVVYWHVVVLPGLAAHPDRAATVLWGLAPIIIVSFFIGPLVVQAFQRGDASSWLLCLVGLLITTGSWLWSITWLYPDLELLSLATLCLAILILIPATMPPRGRGARPWVVSDLGPMVLHFLAWALALSTVLPGSDLRVSYLLGLLTMVTVTLRIALVRGSELQLVRNLRQQALTDPLTGCGNRRSITTAIAAGPGWILSMDMDGFKEVNDRHGHAAGDQVLTDFADRVRRVLSVGGHLARIGGDEFALIFQATSGGAVELGERVVGLGADPRYSGVSVSVGLAAFEAGADPMTVLRDADIAMQRAKREGKGRLSVLSPSMVSDRLRELELASALREGGIDAITLDLQPVRLLDSDRERTVVAVEALARWSPEPFGPVEATELIAIAEQHGLIGRLGSHVLARALDLVRELRDRDALVQVSVNVSGAQLRDPATLDDMARQLGSDRQLTRWMILEVTETVFADDEPAVRALRRLQRTGAQIAIDDFGIGSSTLTRLRRLPVDLIKTDAELSRDLGVATPDAVLDLVVMLGYRLGITVVAEGIEDEETVRELVRIGCLYGQGHHLGAAEPAPALIGRVAGVAGPMLGRRLTDECAG